MSMLYFFPPLDGAADDEIVCIQEESEKKNLQLTARMHNTFIMFMIRRQIH